MAEEHRIRNRWGGDYQWPLDHETRLVISDAVMSSGPGKGIAMLPWALDRYERVLRLRPGETWLLKRMLKHAWTLDGDVYLSQRKIALEARITRPTIAGCARRLEELGYIRRLDNAGSPDRRVHYNVAGIFAALALCVAADPTSRWAQEHGTITPEQAATCSFNGPGFEGNPATFDLDWEAMTALAKRRKACSSASEEEPEDDVLEIAVLEGAQP